jgi:hypothetical protein
MTELPHGLSRYTSRDYRCRCEVCRAAMAAYMRSTRARRRTQPIPDHVTHGTATAYTQWGCRCDDCRAAATQHGRAWRQANPERNRANRRAYYERTHVPAPPRPEPAHGTLSRYSNRRCRCDRCGAANARYQWAQAQARRGQVPDHVAHGTGNAYTNYGCRCDDCRAAQSERMRAYKQARKQAAP